MRPKVSVILTSYNKPQTVRNAIESVLRQTLQEWELFIMDDASNQETNTIIQSYLNDPRIHYYNSNIKDEERYKKTRYAVLINQAIPLTTGKYISYLTDDTEYLPTRLKDMASYLEFHSNRDIVYSGQMIRHVDEQFIIESEITRDAKFILKRAANVVDHCSVLHSKKIVEAVFRKYGSYWDEDAKNWHNGDAAFWSRLNEFQPFYPFPKVLDISYKTPSSFQTLNANLPSTLPDGALIKGLGTDVYLMDKQMRRRITKEMFERLKYQDNKIVTVPDPILFKYPTGVPIDENIFKNQTIPNQRLIKLKGRGGLFYIQDGKKRKIAEPVAIRKFHFKLEEFVHVSHEDIEEIPDGPPIYSTLSATVPLPDGVIFREGREYFISANNVLHLIHTTVLNRLKFSKGEFVIMTKKERLLFKEGDALFFDAFK